MVHQDRTENWLSGCSVGPCPLLAQSGHPDTLNQCLLLGVKRTWRGPNAMSAFDPKRTLSCPRSGPDPDSSVRGAAGPATRSWRVLVNSPTCGPERIAPDPKKATDAANCGLARKARSRAIRSALCRE